MAEKIYTTTAATEASRSFRLTAEQDLLHLTNLTVQVRPQQSEKDSSVRRLRKSIDDI